MSKKKQVSTRGLLQYHCRKCKHNWVARTVRPDECPNCKSRDWTKS